MLTLHTHREMMCYSDFPIKTASLFPTCAEIEKYLNEYVDYFGLRPYIRLRTTVTHVHRTNQGFDRWLITFEEGRLPLVRIVLDSRSNTTFSGTTGRLMTQEFDAVLVCSGMFAKPNIPPPFPGSVPFVCFILGCSCFN